MEEDRRLAAIMFTDIVGYTALMGSDEDRAFQLLQRNREIHRPLIRKYRGTWLKEMGDGILASFHTASDAVRCAGEILSKASEDGISLRIGIHEGEVVFTRGDVLGDGVNIASRLEEMAEEGALIVSGSVYGDIKNKTGIRTEFLGEKEFKNVSEPIRVYRVFYDELDTNSTKAGQIYPSKRAWPVVLAAIALVALVAFLLVYLLPAGRDKEKNRTEKLSREEKSIAVLPFRNYSADPENQYLADGTMDAILLHLSRLGDLRVISRTSMEQYRDTDKTTEQIGRELEVAFLLEGSFQKQGDRVRLIVQLLRTADGSHRWANQYDLDWIDIFAVQSEVAQTIAGELGGVITPAERERMNQRNTTDLTAYDFFQRAEEELYQFRIGNSDPSSLERAESLFRSALSYDPAFARAYAGLAWVYWNKHFWGEYFSGQFMDSVLILANHALSCNNETEEAYYLIASTYFFRGDRKRAIENFNEAMRLNPNNALFLGSRAYAYQVDGDYVSGLADLHQAILRNRGRELPDLLRRLGDSYMNVGLKDKAIRYYMEALMLSADSARFYANLSSVASSEGEDLMATEWLEKAIKKSPKILGWEHLTRYAFAGRHGDVYQYFLQLVDSANTSGTPEINISHRIGYSCWKLGKDAEAQKFFNEQIRYGEESIMLKRPYAQGKRAHYDLAAVYAFLGDRKKAYMYLDEFEELKFYPMWWVNLIKNDPLFDGIRHEEHFQRIVLNMERKFQMEQARVKQWLESQEAL